MQPDLTPPDGAVWHVSDLTDFRRDKQPVDGLAPIELPDDAYFEFGWLDADGAFVLDPEHPVADNPWYPGKLHAATGSRYTAHPLNLPADAEPAGVLERVALQSATLGQKRRLMLYTPPGVARDDETRLLYVHDGLGFHHYARLPAVVDRLLANDAIPPVKLVLVQPIDRETEYPFNDRYLEFTVNELVPFVEREQGFAGNGRRAALGASLSGLFSAMLAWRVPELVQTVVALSGAFLGGPDAPDDHHGGSEWLRQQVRGSARKPLRFVLACGSLEWLTEPNRRLAAALREQGYAVAYTERTGGHNWVNWRNLLGEALRNGLAD